MKVFIAHSSQDHQFVLKLAKKLQEDRIDVWIDDWEIKVGDSIVAKINEGLERSGFLIIVFSKHSLQSPWVQRELNATLMRQIQDNDAKILPIFLEIRTEEVPPLFRDIYGVEFSSIGINEDSYKKLIEPIKDKLKAKKLKFEDVFLENVEHIDIIIKKDQPTKQEVEFVLRLIKQDPAYENYFFRKVFNPIWFNVLKEEGYFSWEKAPRPQFLEEKEGWIVPFWNVLEYLEKVSQQVNISGNEEYIDDLLTIIKDVTSYHIEHDKILDNYLTWW